MYTLIKGSNLILIRLFVYFESLKMTIVACFLSYKDSLENAIMEVSNIFLQT